MCRYELRVETLSQHSDWVKGLACETTVLCVGSLVIMSKIKSSAATPSLRKYLQPSGALCYTS